MIYIIFSLILYTAGILIGTTASRNANTNLVSAVVNVFSIFIPLAIAIPLLSKKTFHIQKYGILMSVLGGVVISLFVLSISKAYSENKVGIVAPIVFGGAISLSTILSYFFFKEKISAVEGAGLALVLAGLAVVLYARATNQ